MFYFWMLILLVFGAQTGDVTIGTAPVTDVEVITEDDGVNAVVSGNMTDGCTTAGDWSQVVKADAITIDLRSERPADALCTQALVAYETTIPVALTGLVGGEIYRVEVNSVSSEPFTLPNELVDESACPEAVGPEVVFINNAAAYCMLYPADYVIDTVQEANSNITTIRPPVTNADEGQAPTNLTIIAQPAEGLTLEAFTEREQETYPNAELEFTEIQMGDEPAVLTTDVPGIASSIYAGVVARERLYTFNVVPLDEGFWFGFQRSFTLLTEDTTVTCAEPTEDTRLYTAQTDGYCLLIPASAEVIAPGESDNPLPETLRIIQPDGVLLDIQRVTKDGRTLQQILTDELPARALTGVEFAELTVNGFPALEAGNIIGRVSGGVVAVDVDETTAYLIELGPLNDSNPTAIQNSLDLFALALETFTLP